MPVHERKSQKQLGSPAVAASWQGILDVIPAGAYTCDVAGLITYFNPLKLFGAGRRNCGTPLIVIAVL